MPLTLCKLSNTLDWKFTSNSLRIHFKCNFKFTLNSVLQNHFIGNKISKSDQQKISFDIFNEIMFAFLLLFFIENFKQERYYFARNNRIGGLNDYPSELRQTMFHNKNFHNRLFNSMAISVVYK